MALTGQFTQKPPIAGPCPGPLSGGGRFRLAILAVAASLLTAAPAPSWGQKGSDLRDDIEFDLPRVSREPPDLIEAIVEGVLYKSRRWDLLIRESDAPPEATAGSGQQRRTTSVPNLLDPFKIVGRGGSQSQRTGAASATPGGFDVSRNFNPPARLGGSARQRSPVNSSNRSFRGLNTLGGANRRTRG